MQRRWIERDDTTADLIRNPSCPATPRASRFCLILDEPMATEPLSYMWIENRPRRTFPFDTNEYLDESA